MEYIENTLYKVLVTHLTEILRAGKRTLFNPHPKDDADGLHMHLMAALRLASIDMGELVFAPPRVESTKGMELVAALAALEPDPFTGNFEADQVKWVLGEEGDIWPESIREDVEAA